MSLVDAKFITDEERGYVDEVYSSTGIQQIDESFDSNITISIGTDARASDKEVIRKERQRGNLWNLFNNYNNGSKLWLLEQARLGQESKNIAITYTKNSLQWLVTDGFLKDVKVNGSLSTNGITINIQLQRLDGQFDNFRFTAFNNSIYRT